MKACIVAVGTLAGILVAAAVAVAKAGYFQRE